MRVVIVGGGLAGGNAAVGLREEGFDGEVIVLGDEPGLPFGRPPLSKTYLWEKKDHPGWLVKRADWYETHDVQLRTTARVTRIDPAGGRVVLEDGTDIACDRICVATGCHARIPNVDGVNLDGVLTLRTISDANAIRGRARPGAKVVVAGMSFIGSEVAASLRRLGAEVTAVFPGSGPMAAVLGDEVAARMAAIHEANGVELVAGDKVVAFHGDGRVERVVTERGRTIDAELVVLGLGVDPAVGALDGSGVTVEDGVMVDAACRTSVPEIVAAGDVANHDHPLFGRVRVEHYNNAEKQGRHAARTMLGSDAPYDYLHSFWSDQYEHKIEYVGFAKSWDRFVTRGDVDGATFLGFYLKEGVLLAAMGLNRGGDPELEPDSELAACAELIRARRRVDPARLTDEDVDLRSMG